MAEPNSAWLPAGFAAATREARMLRRATSDLVLAVMTATSPRGEPGQPVRPSRTATALGCVDSRVVRLAARANQGALGHPSGEEPPRQVPALEDMIDLVEAAEGQFDHTVGNLVQNSF
jgi:hypothetical protein